jgi:hypothetical protein
LNAICAPARDSYMATTVLFGMRRSMCPCSLAGDARVGTMNLSRTRANGTSPCLHCRRANLHGSPPLAVDPESGAEPGRFRLRCPAPKSESEVGVRGPMAESESEFRVGGVDGIRIRGWEIPAPELRFR